MALEALWYVPPSQGVHAEAPAAAEYEPAAHCTGVVAPSTHAEPAGQASQPGCPPASCHVPASHREQTDAPASAYSPAPHGSATAAPVSHAEPSGHSTQSSTAVRLVALLPYRPEGHGSGAAERSVQYRPGVQATHAVLPSFCWYSPASHGVHVALPGSGLTVPGAHGVASAEPTEQNFPSEHVMHWSTAVITSRLVF